MTNAQRNHIDLPLLTAVLLLMVLSLGVVYSASATWAYEKFGESDKLLNVHMIKVLLGIGALFLGMFIPYQKYQKWTKVVLMGAIALLAVTLVLGGETKGATRWLHLGGMSFQPSEFAKFALLFHLCSLAASKGDGIRDFKRGFVPMLIWIVPVVGLVMLQPNFSGGAMIAALSLMMLFIVRARILHIAGTMLLGLPALGVYAISAPYRMQRLLSFFNGGGSGKDNYQLFQGIIGFGVGGIFGVGPGESRQRDFFLPESYGDFVFSVVGEEYGLIGTMFFLFLFLLIMSRGFKIARAAGNPFGRYLAVAITCTITFYALVNAGVTLGILPTTGQPMPFVSYGGSALLFSAFAIGVLLNISAFTDMHPRARTKNDSEHSPDVTIVVPSQ
jgi:cell division protein FtsW